MNSAQFTFATIALFLLFCVAVAIGAELRAEESQMYPRLVGHGCDAAGGPLYAYEEDDFPPCDAILATHWE